MIDALGFLLGLAFCWCCGVVPLVASVNPWVDPWRQPMLALYVLRLKAQRPTPRSVMRGLPYFASAAFLMWLEF